MTPRDVIRESLIVDATRAVTTKAIGILHRLEAAGYVILPAAEVQAIRDKALEEAGTVADVRARMAGKVTQEAAWAVLESLPDAIRALKGEKP